VWEESDSSSDEDDMEGGAKCAKRKPSDSDGTELLFFILKKIMYLHVQLDIQLDVRCREN
jgi:hypothetical protein